MKTREELEEAIKDTIKVYKEINFGSDTATCIACSKPFISMCIIKVNG